MPPLSDFLIILICAVVIVGTAFWIIWLDSKPLD
jgi:hypothetical protein